MRGLGALVVGAAATTRAIVSQQCRFSPLKKKTPFNLCSLLFNLLKNKIMNPASKQISKISGWMWSSTESGALTAWHWYSGTWDRYSYKSNSYAAVPFFAIKKESALLKSLNYKVVK